MKRRQIIGLILLVPAAIFVVLSIGWLIYTVIREGHWVGLAFIALIACTIIGFGMMGD